MKTGGPTQRLSERLNADLDALRQENVDLMASQLETFRSDLTTIANDARHIIEADSLTATHEMSAIWREATRRFRGWLTLSPWVIFGIVLTSIAILMALSWIWVQAIGLHALTTPGLTITRQDGMTVLLLDPDRTEMRTCTLIDRPMICIELQED